MKITKRQLRRIIREEKRRILSEDITKRDEDTIGDIIEELKAAVEMHKSQHERLQAILDRLVEDREQK